jgi:hypothetical protein
MRVSTSSTASMEVVVAGPILRLRHVRLALVATWSHTPMGGVLPGSILNGVNVGSER